MLHAVIFAATEWLFFWLTKEGGNVLTAGASLISDVVDLDSSLDGCMVQQGVCRALDDLKHTLSQLPEFLTQASSC
jgi:hypothetical protein